MAERQQALFECCKNSCLACFHKKEKYDSQESEQRFRTENSWKWTASSSKNEITWCTNWLLFGLERTNQGSLYQGFQGCRLLEACQIVPTKRIFENSLHRYCGAPLSILLNSNPYVFHKAVSRTFFWIDME